MTGAVLKDWQNEASESTCDLGNSIVSECVHERRVCECNNCGHGSGDTFYYFLDTKHFQI